MAQKGDQWVSCEHDNDPSKASEKETCPLEFLTSREVKLSFEVLFPFDSEICHSLDR